MFPHTYLFLCPQCFKIIIILWNCRLTTPFFGFDWCYSASFLFLRLRYDRTFQTNCSHQAHMLFMTWSSCSAEGYVLPHTHQRLADNYVLKIRSPFVLPYTSIFHGVVQQLSRILVTYYSSTLINTTTSTTTTTHCHPTPWETGWCVILFFLQKNGISTWLVWQDKFYCLVKLISSQETCDTTLAKDLSGLPARSL